MLEVLAISSPLLPLPPPPNTCTGWQTPEIALIDSHKLLRSIILLLMGSDVLSIQKTAVETPFLDYGESREERYHELNRLDGDGEAGSFVSRGSRLDPGSIHVMMVSSLLCHR